MPIQYKSKGIEIMSFYSLSYRLINQEKLLVILSQNTDGNPKVIHEFINSAHENFETVLTMVRQITASDQAQNLSEDQANTILKLTSIREQVREHLLGNGSIYVSGNFVYHRDTELFGYEISLLLRMVREGRNVQPLALFIENLLRNPSYRVREQLYRFLEAGGNALTSDGRFLAYKYVSDNYTSVFDGKTDHSLGATVSMDRALVDDDPSRTCSSGLHCCSIDYLGSYSQGYRIVCVKVDPADVVAVPLDYKDSKMRVCCYQVVGELSRDEVERNVLASQCVIDDYDEDPYEDDSDYEINRPESSFIEDIQINPCNLVLVEMKNGAAYEYIGFSEAELETIEYLVDLQEVSFSVIFNERIRHKDCAKLC